MLWIFQPGERQHLLMRCQGTATRAGVIATVHLTTALCPS